MDSEDTIMFSTFIISSPELALAISRHTHGVSSLQKPQSKRGSGSDFMGDIVIPVGSISNAKGVPALDSGDDAAESS
jgi:hypothetical protein